MDILPLKSRGNSFGTAKLANFIFGPQHKYLNSSNTLIQHQQNLSVGFCPTLWQSAFQTDLPDAGVSGNWIL